MATPGLNLTPKEAETLKKFEENVKDVLKPGQDEYYLIRWLRARNFDLKKAEDMLRKSVAWRKMYKVDSILTDWERPEVLQKYWPGGFHGFDKEGRPIWIARAGDHLDTKGMIMSASKKDILKNTIYHMEKLQQIFAEQSKKLGRRVDKSVFIDDMDSFSTKHLLIPGQDILLKIFALIEANYPESLGVCYVINAPRILPLIFKIVRPFLHEETAKKMVLLTGDWKATLLEGIDADQLPVHWGGTATDPDGDPQCISKVIYGGTVPESYYLKGNQLVDENSTTTVTIGRGKSIELEYTVPQDGHLLRWVYWTESYDIEFGVSYKDGSELKEVEPAIRADCNLVPEDGFVVCEKAGTYVVKFDNSYSWVHSKKLSYSLQVVDPEAVSEMTAKSAAIAEEMQTTQF